MDAGSLWEGDQSEQHVHSQREQHPPELTSIHHHARRVDGGWMMGGMENDFSLGSVSFHVLTMVNFVFFFFLN